MASTAELSILITGKNQAGKAFNDAEKSVSGFSKALSGVSTVAGGFLAANVVQTGLAKLTDFASNSIDAFRDSQAAAAQLSAVLKSTAGAAGVTADEVTNLAAALEKQSLFEDEAIIRGQSMLLTFTNIGRTVMPQATQAIVDMSQAMGQDLQSSAIQVGKALNDPIAGISALSRVGVTFNEQQKEMIRSMVVAGDVAGAQTLILAELSKEFGGSAKAASDAAGATEVQKDRMNELNEVIGQKLLPIQEKWKELQVAAITFLVEVAIPAIDRWIQQHPEIVAAMASVANFIAEHWPQIETVIVTVLDNIATKIEGFIQVVSSIVAIITDVVDTVDAVIHGRWAEAWVAFIKIPADVLAVMEGMFKEAFGNAGTWLVDAGQQIMQGLWDGMKSKFEEVKDWVSGVGGTLADLKGPLSKDSVLLAPAGKAIMQGLQNGLAEGATGVYSLVGGVASAIQAALEPIGESLWSGVSKGSYPIGHVVGGGGGDAGIKGLPAGKMLPIVVQIDSREIGRTIVDLSASGALRGVI